MVPYSTDFSEHTISIGVTELFFRKGGPEHGPATLLLHGHTQTSSMWAPLANQLAASGRQVIAVDLHGLGSSAPAIGRYDKKKMAADFNTLMHMMYGPKRSIAVIGHDLGVFAAYAYAAQFPKTVSHLVFMDATIPGIGTWTTLLQQPRAWHFGFFGPHAVKLVTGRERIYLNRFWDEFALNPNAISSAARELYTSYYQMPGRVKSALSHFEAFGRDALDNQNFAKTSLTMPILGLGGSHSLGKMMGDHLPLLGSNVSNAIIEDAGHWLLEENPTQTIKFIQSFLATQ